MKVRWFETYLFLLAQTLPDVLAGTSRVALPSPSTPQLEASENENDTDGFPAAPGVKPGRLTVLPDDGRALYLRSGGGKLHLSNPVFPRSFPKIIIIDAKLFVYGSACLDETTFMQYRDFATTNADPQILSELEYLFENDWTYSAEVGQQPASFNAHEFTRIIVSYSCPFAVARYSRSVASATASVA
jgi:hypothetical protein